MPAKELDPLDKLIDDFGAAAGDDLDDEIPKGLALIQALHKEAESRGLNIRDLGDFFELKASYWQHILLGNRSIQGLARHRLQLIADFLNVSYVNVLCLAELVTPEDFVVTATIDDQLNLAFLKYKADPYWCTMGVTDAQWDQTPRPVKIAFVHMYERIVGNELLTKSRLQQVDSVPFEPAVEEAVVPSSPLAVRAKRKKPSKKATEGVPA
jgi:hypothetical protein